MIAKPTSLASWTLDLVREIAASGIPENDWYDFKADLQPADHQRKIVAAFANTQGGFLVFGVNNNREVVGLDKPELPRDFGIKLTKDLFPSPGFEFGPPMLLDGRSSVWICYVPRSKRGPHAVLQNDSWVFPRRTESGSNVSMNVEEIRGAFLDSGRRASELAWLKAEVVRIRELAQMKMQSTGEGWGLDMLLSRFDATQLRTLLVSVYSYLDNGTDLVENIQDLVRRAEIVDGILAQIAVHKLNPRDISTSSSGRRPFDTVEKELPQIVNCAHKILDALNKVLAA
jgi:hypothetical protein